MNIQSSMVKQSGPASLSVMTRCPLWRGVHCRGVSVKQGSIVVF